MIYIMHCAKNMFACVITSLNSLGLSGEDAMAHLILYMGEPGKEGHGQGHMGFSAEVSQD